MGVADNESIDSNIHSLDPVWYTISLFIPSLFRYDRASHHLFNLVHTSEPINVLVGGPTMAFSMLLSFIVFDF